ncbi:MAG: hypothetical protein HY820_45830 [Acidobacteria bacterium]|nr:hypothetical protein [Acidobacteriota bacterium]
MRTVAVASFPADVGLHIQNKECSPGVRRMEAVLGQEAPFAHGPRKMKLLADLEVTAKAAERNAEAIGTWDEEGFAIRDPDSTTYVAAIETCDEFGRRAYLEAWRRGWSRAVQKVVMGDGSEWIWNQAQLHFPAPRGSWTSTHAREHQWELARRLHPNDEARQNRWMMFHRIGSTTGSSRSW